MEDIAQLSDVPMHSSDPSIDAIEILFEDSSTLILSKNAKPCKTFSNNPCTLPNILRIVLQHTSITLNTLVESLVATADGASNDIDVAVAVAVDASVVGIDDDSDGGSGIDLAVEVSSHCVDSL